MEIVCQNCKTSHYLSDDKIPLETKVGKCKKCNAAITVLGKNDFGSIIDGNNLVTISETKTESLPVEQEETKIRPKIFINGVTMRVTCPKCNYTRKPTDITPSHECPKCGVIYAKVIQRTDAQAKSQEESDQVATVALNYQTKIAERPKVFLSIAFALGLLMGYFLGREHIKYELRSALQDVTAGFSKSLGAAFGSSDSRKPEDNEPPVKVKQSYPITATLTKKGWFEGEYGRNAITFTVTFANSTNKNIRAFDGTLVFTDLLGNEILGAKLAINEPVNSGQSIEWEGKLDYNQFIAKHESLRNADVQNIKVDFILKRTLFEDGEVKDF